MPDVVTVLFSSIATVMHCGRCPRDVDEELPQGLSTINKEQARKNNSRSLWGASRVCYLLWVVCLLFVCFITYCKGSVVVELCGDAT